MNVVLWIVQIVLALFFIAGGGYKMANAAALSAPMPAMAPGLWVALGAIEAAGGLLLVAPGMLSRWPGLRLAPAVLLIVESVGLSAFYASYSTAMAASNPLVWSLGLAVMTTVLAVGRAAIGRSA